MRLSCEKVMPAGTIHLLQIGGFEFFIGDGGDGYNSDNSALCTKFDK